MATSAVSDDKTPHTYQKGTITGWETRIDIRAAGSNGQRTKRRTRVFELKTPDFIYEVDDCGSFQAGQFSAGQTVDYRVDEGDPHDKRIYIRRDDGKEYKCKMDGARAIATPKPDAPSDSTPSAKP